MPLNSFKNAIGHVENALFMMKGKRHDDQSDSMAYGNSCPQYHNSIPIPPQHLLPQQDYRQPLYSPPAEWSQHWDHGSQRYYYIERMTGRSQWEPPAHQFHQSPRPTSSHHQQRHSGEYSKPGMRPHSNSSVSHMSRDGSPMPKAVSIPPGYSLDTRTGQLVSTMLPPSGHHSAPVKYW